MPGHKPAFLLSPHISNPEPGVWMMTRFVPNGGPSDFDHNKTVESVKSLHRMYLARAMAEKIDEQEHRFRFVSVEVPMSGDDGVWSSGTQVTTSLQLDNNVPVNGNPPRSRWGPTWAQLWAKVRGLTRRT